MGILRWERDPGFFLEFGRGGRWELDFPGPLADEAEPHIGALVKVEGVRTGFNILSVHGLRRSFPDGELEIGMRRWWVRFFG